MAAEKLKGIVELGIYFTKYITSMALIANLCGEIAF